MKKVIRLTESDLVSMIKQIINEKHTITESLSIDVGLDDDKIKFATPNSKKVINIEKNTKYPKNKHSVISVTNNKGINYDYMIYVFGSPLNIESISPQGDNVLISYYNGKRDKKTKKALTNIKSLKLDDLKGYIPDLLSGEKEISSFTKPVKLVKVN